MRSNFLENLQLSPEADASTMIGQKVMDVCPHFCYGQAMCFATTTVREGQARSDSVT